MSRRGLVLFLALGVAWGIPYALIKVAVGELAPAMVVLSRTALAGAILLPVALVRGEVRPILRRWRPLVAYTVAEIVVPWYFLNSAEERLPSSTAGLLIAAVPLVGVGVAFLMGRRERFTPSNWLGIALGMGGVAAIVGLDVAGSDLSSVGEVAIVSVCYALGPAILARWMSDLPATGIVALSLGGAAVVYVPIVLLSGSWPAHWPSGNVVAAVATLVLVCSAAAFMLMVALVSEIGPVRMTAVTYVNPAVAILVGALLLGERITVWTVVGFVLVLTGSYLLTQRRARQSQRLPDEPPAIPAGASPSHASVDVPAVIDI